MEKNILFRAVVEVLGKPKEHVESSLQGYLEKLKNDDRYSIHDQQVAELKKQDEAELWMIFAELEIRTAKVEDLTNFCYDYMPSLIDIMEPSKLSLDASEVSTFLNDLQAKLHGVDMVAKQLKIENDVLRGNTGKLLNNYIILILGRRKLTSTQLSNLTGVDKDKLEDFLDKLIDEGKVDLDGDQYYLKESIAVEK